MQENLRKMTAKSYKAIVKSLAKEQSSAWLADNFYVIHKHYQGVKKCKKAFECRNIYALLEKYCHQRDYLVTPNGIIDYFSAQSKNFSFLELSSIKTLLSALGINKIAKLVLEDKAVLLPNVIKLLISLSDPKYNDIVGRLWAAERVLAKAEDNYLQFDDETKDKYRKSVAETAKKRRISETEAAKLIAEEAKRKKQPLGDFVYRKSNLYILAWCLILGIVFLGLTALGALVTGWLTAVLVVPFFAAATAVADDLCSIFITPYRAPRLKTAPVPDNAKTLVAVAALMQGDKSDSRVFESLERFRYMNPDKNVYFCLLADLPDSKEQYRIEDNGIINNARKEIDKLNKRHGGGFCMFFRERVYNKSEDKFGGWERKRGAVCELVSHIVKGDKTEYYGGDFIRDIKYLITLDTDTNLSVESVREMLAVAMHPVNRPVIKNGKVCRGYGIIQPAIRTELESAYKSGFSRLISGAGGADIYARAGFHRGQTLFGSGSFCGKGLIDVSCFAQLVLGKLPEGLVLSHDCIEGSILRTVCVSDIILTDSTPGNTVSYFRRAHRWMRGDFQNLYFLGGKLISPLSKWRLVLTAFRHTTALFSVLAVSLAAFFTGTSGLWLFLLAYAQLFLPCVLTFIRFFAAGKPFAVIRFFSRAYSVAVQTVFNLLFEIVASARKAELTLNAYIRAAVRTVTRKKTLEWTTAAQTEALGSALGKFVTDGAFSVALGVGLLFFAIPPFVKLCGLLYFVYPLVSVIISRRLEGGLESRPALGQRQQKMLVSHAKDMFGFYADNVGEKTNFLPPDNLQFSPVTAVAMRTSPTNIGFYLVSVLAARDLDIITTEEMYTRLDKCLSAVERLDKYRGNLYNWYDIGNMQVIGEEFVSSVDSGNFLVMLSALKEGVKEYICQKEEFGEISLRCKRLIDQTDLSILYDKDRSLFKIGVKPNADNGGIGHYDLLMSECRMTAYFAVARGIAPKKHWQSLGRVLTHKKGFLGMLSWSGTAFEYFMPQLFLPLYKDSFIYESIAFAAMMQKSEESPWGISESGFYLFDSEMNYQYKAHGMQALALRRIGDNERVVSPYSAYLSLCVLGESAIKNLIALENKGMYGRYGLYEAFDKNGDSGGLCVKSYMAHHVGMSIIAVLNAVRDNIFVRRFMADKQMSCANELLQEKIPVEAHIFENDRNARIVSGGILKPEISTKTVLSQSPSAALITRGDIGVTVTSNGHIGMHCGDKAICNTVYEQDSLRFSPCVLFARGNKAYGCARLYGNDGEFGFEKGRTYASQIVSGKEFSGSVRYSIAKNCNCIKISTRAESLKKYSVTLAFRPVLDSEKSFRSHIAFSNLFLESEYDKQKRILYFHRRSRLDGKHILSIAVAPKDKGMGFGFLTGMNGVNHEIISSPFDYAFLETDNICGECINPVCLVRNENAEGGRCCFLVTCGETKQQCERNIRICRNDKEETAITDENGILESLLPALLYGNGYSVKENFSKCGINDLWAKGISGDYPLAAVYMKTPAINRTDSVISAFLALARASVRCELIFIVSDEDKYNRPAENTVFRRCAALGANAFLGVNGGIFVIKEGDISNELFEALKSAAAYFADFEKPEADQRFENGIANIVTAPQSRLPLPLPENGIKAGNGFFIGSGYTVDKSNKFPAPYSFILTGYRFSTVLTQNSLGYSFFDNARERRLGSFFGDKATLDSGERIFLSIDGIDYDLCAVSDRVRFEKGKAIYSGEINGNGFTVTVTVHPKYPVKLVRVQLTESGVTVLSLKPVMGDKVYAQSGIEVIGFNTKDSHCIAFRNSFGMTFPDGVGFAGVCGGRAEAKECRLYCGGSDNLFFYGACTTENAAKALCNKISLRFFEEAIAKAEDFAGSLVPKIKINSESRLTDALFNFFLPYQISACRFYARGSFYQSGGAYGFRDQLQDCLGMIYSNPKAVRTHIIRCCAHQYEEGCVMHWWHTRNFGGVNRGVKTKCSDDLLYLPIVLADYLEKTEDFGITEVLVGYLSSPTLKDKAERYEQPKKSGLKETIYDHCVRALDYGYKLGKHGLILMGSCDWNDAFSLVGEKGVGESVFSSMLYIIAAKSFITLCRNKKDIDFLTKLEQRITDLKKNLEAHCFFEDRYARAFCDDGSILGIEAADECKIDILSQAFAAMAGLDAQRAKIGLKTAYQRLYDGKNKIFKLFSPAFGDGNARVGYIRGYVYGIRENGGQYTHGALWGALGCIIAGMHKEALDILDCVNPATRYENRALGKKYKNEPYAISADIYGGRFAGVGGWSWYTGAAAWYYRILLEYVYGIRLGADRKIISVKPIVPFSGEIIIDNSRLKITASRDFGCCKLNGKEISFPIYLPHGDCELEVPLI